MKSLVNTFINNIESERLNVLYVQIRQDGEVKEYWSKFSKMSRLESYSTSKSFCAVGIGIAIDEGIISLDEKVSKSFPEYTYNITNPNALDITVKDMLAMSSGLKDPLFFRDDALRATTRDWVEHFYQVGDFIRKPGEKFLYCNFNTYMLGCLVEKKTGMNLHEYMRYRLFEPLGIGNPDMTICPMGHTVGANGMAINVDELGRFGQMLLNKGEFEGKRIVSSKFVEDMVTPHISTDKALPSNPDRNYDYGYQIWIDKENKCFNLWGIFGQYCIVIPHKDAVVTVVSLEENDSAVEKRVWEDLVLQL